MVAQDWKWLFIYPEQGIAVVNELVFPSRTPLSLRHHLGHGDELLLHPGARPARSTPWPACRRGCICWPTRPGAFVGRNIQYSGAGFADQHFEAIATSPDEFDAWVAKVKQSPDKLDAATYRALAGPASGHPVTYYSAVEPNLFDTIVAKYRHEPARAHQHAGQ